MKRKEAMKKVAEFETKNLSKGERGNLLIGWWNIDEEDNEFHLIPESLQNEMKENSEYGNPGDKKYDPLILIALIHKFKGVRNEYIERELKKFISDDIEVKGEIENLEKCPCCGYKTLLERRAWDICEVCYWEDDGIEELDIESGPNRMTLRQAKESFKEIGACEERLLQFTEKEPDLKYEK